MKTSKYEDNQAWLEARLGRITGSRLKDVVVKRGTENKMGYYQLIAERLSLPADDENVMDRGHRLEEEAIAKFSEKTGKAVITDLVIWERDDNSRIAVSPDGYTQDGEDLVLEAVEVKCLASANHIKAFLTQQVPTEYEEQVIQYFIVNDQLETLYFVFYDPRLVVESFFYLTISRSTLVDKIEKYHIEQLNVLDRVEAVVKSLLPF